MNNQYNYNNLNTSYTRVLTKNQSLLLQRSSLIAGIGFLLTCAIGFLLKYLIENNHVNYNVLIPLSSVFLIFSMLLSLTWSFMDWFTKGPLLTIVTMAVFIVSNGIGFGSMFVYFNVSEIMFAFLIVGLILLGCWGITKIMSFKAAASLSKILWTTSIVFMIFTLVISLVFAFAPISFTTSKTIWIATFSISGLLSIGYLVFIMWNISKNSAFVNLGDNKMLNKLAFSYGFMILVNILVILRIVLMFMGLSSSNRD